MKHDHVRPLFILLFISSSLLLFVCAAEWCLGTPKNGAGAPLFGIGLWVVCGLGAGLAYRVRLPASAVRLKRPESLTDRSQGTVRFTLQGGSVRIGEAQRCTATWWDKAGDSLVLSETRSGRVALTIPWDTVSRNFLRLRNSTHIKEPVRVLLLCQPVLQGKTKEAAPVVVKLHLTHCHDIDSLRKCFRGCPPQTRELSSWLGHDLPMKSGYNRFCSPAHLSDFSYFLSRCLSSLAPLAAVSKWLRAVGGTGIVSKVATASHGLLESLPLCICFPAVTIAAVWVSTLLRQYRERTARSLFTVCVTAVSCVFLLLGFVYWVTLAEEFPALGSMEASQLWITYSVATVAVVFVACLHSVVRRSFIACCIAAVTRELLGFLLLASASWMALTNESPLFHLAESCILLSGPIGSWLFQVMPALAKKVVRSLEYMTCCHPMRPGIVKKLSVFVRAYQYHETDWVRYLCGYVFAKDVQPLREPTIEDDGYLEDLMKLTETSKDVEGEDWIYTADILISYLEALNFNAWGDVLSSACRCRCHYVINMILRREASRWDVEAAIHVAAQQGHADVLATLHQHIKEHHPHALPVRGGDERTVLHTAADHGHKEVVTRVLAEHGLFCVEATDRTTNGLTALHFASLAGQDAVAELLVTRCPEQAWDCAHDGRTVLHCAAAGGAVALIKRIAEGASGRPIPLTEDGLTPLHCAAERWQCAAVEALLEKLSEEDRPTHLEAKTQRGWTPLHLACGTGADVEQRDVVLFLLKSGANLDARTGLDTEEKHGDTAVELAVDSGNSELLKLFARWQRTYYSNLHGLIASDGRTVFHRVKSSACLNTIALAPTHPHWRDLRPLVTALTTDGRTVLHCAAQNGACDVYADLRGRVFRLRVTVPERTNDDLTCLHYAAEGGHVSMVSQLMTHYTKATDYQAKSKVSGNTPLHLAVLEGHDHVISKLLATDAGRTALTSENCEGETPLHLAARRGGVAAAEALLHAGAEVDARNTVGDTPLHLAFNDLMAERLIKQNADVHAVGKSERLPLNVAARRGDLAVVTVLLHEMKRAQARGCSAPVAHPPLHDAAGGGHTVVVEALCKWDRSMVWQTDRDGNTVLHAAAETGLREVVETLCAEDEASVGYKPGDIARARNHRQKTPLHLAAEAGHLEVVKFLATKYPDLCEYLDGEMKTPLHSAARYDNPQTVEYLVTNFPNLCEARFHKLCPTPLHYAAASGSREMVEFFAKHCSQMCELQDDTGKTPLHYAARSFGRSCGNIETTQFLVTKCPEMCKAQDHQGKTPLHHAARCGNLETVKFLATECPEMGEMRDNKDRTPLHDATGSGDLKAVQFLATECPEMCKKQDDEGNTPLHHAACDGNLETVQFLAAECPEICKVRDDEGKTPLHHAARDGNLETVQFLVTECPEICKVRDDEGKKPLHHAAEWGHLETAQFLKMRKVRDKNDKMPSRDGAGSGTLETDEVLVTRCPEMCTVRDNEAKLPLAAAGCGAAAVAVCDAGSEEGVASAAEDSRLS